MRVFRGIPANAAPPCVLTIGNFDGVHRGHQALLSRLTHEAEVRQLPAAVLTFEPHPREYFTPEQAPARLASLRDKLLQLEASGVDAVCVCRFNAALAALSAEDFIAQVLVRGLNVRHLIIGDDFRFGAQRKGDFALLQAAGAQYGFTVEAMPTLAEHALRVSSSAVRTALAAGDLAQAECLLGRPYSLAGRVVKGQQLGRTLGFPTANIHIKHAPPLSGVFAVRVDGLAPHPVAGVANLGVRPTVNAAPRPVLEVHLFDWQQSCYGAQLRVHFLARLRTEQKFPSLAALTEQIARDADQARAWFAAHPFKN